MGLTAKPLNGARQGTCFVSTTGSCFTSAALSAFSLANTCHGGPTHELVTARCGGLFAIWQPHDRASVAGVNTPPTMKHSTYDFHKSVVPSSAFFLPEHFIKTHLSYNPFQEATSRVLSSIHAVSAREFSHGVLLVTVYIAPPSNSSPESKRCPFSTGDHKIQLWTFKQTTSPRSFIPLPH